MRTVAKEELIEILDKHLKWLRGENGGERANLSYADLRSADLSYANLRSAKNVPFIPISCPDTGSFIAWKKVNGYIIKLQIPEDAKRCYATTTKCRCDKALVMAIEKFDGTAADVDSVVNHNYVATTYKVGEMVYPDSFIERKAAIDACFNGWNNNAHDCAENIRSIPAADVRPVVRGTWVGIDDFPHEDWECDNCGCVVGNTDDPWNYYHYCPNCGADMRGES